MIPELMDDYELREAAAELLRRGQSPLDPSEVARQFSKLRKRKGRKPNPNAEDIRHMRRAGMTLAKLASAYGISIRTVSRICSEKGK
jgi:DNA invertase Pin-like site-specific DNA recombinase